MTAPDPQPEPIEPEVARVFLEHAREMMRWHVARADTFERRAGVLLGFSGAIVAVVIGVGQGTFAQRHPPGWAWGALVLSGVAFLAAGALAIVVLAVRTHAYPALDDVEKAWNAYRGGGDLSEGKALSLVVNQLLRPVDESGRPAKDNPVRSLANDATTRGRWLTAATWTFGGAVLLLIIPGAWALANRLGK